MRSGHGLLKNESPEWGEWLRGHPAVHSGYSGDSLFRLSVAHHPHP